MVWLIYGLGLALAASTPADIPNPRASNGWVSDTANILTASDEADMNAALERLHQDTDVEMALVTVDDVVGTPKSFTTALFNHWGVGDAETNNGLLVVLVLGQRRLEMETGYGLEGRLPDGWLGTMQADHMVPLFKAGDYAGGLQVGVAKVGARLRDPSAPMTQQQAQGLGEDSTKPRSSEGWLHTVFAVVCTLIFVWCWFLLVVRPLWRWFASRRRERFCDPCGTEMLLLSEAADDAHLSEGQEAEERVGSANWLVYECQSCDFGRIVRRDKWFSGKVLCIECGFETSKERSFSEVAATYTHGGRVRVESTCSHCSFVHIHHYNTPKKTHSSNSSSGSGGGGGSFGGGSSGGGGAGSSW